MLTAIVGVVVLLGGLIFFHEFGHYSIAKLFGVKVEVFSLGFGKKLFSRQMGETEYCLSLIPFGGYVKLMGDDPYKGVPAGEAARAFSTQKLYKRFAIVAAGPLANLLLAYILFLVVFWSGQPVASSRIGNVNVASPAWDAGLRSRDKITAVSGVKTETWHELEEILKTREGQKVELSVLRGSTEVQIPITVSRVRARNPYGEEEEVGGIKGISQYPIAALIGVSNPSTAAFVAGLRTGDLVSKFDGKPVLVWNELVQAVEQSWTSPKTVTVTVKRRAGSDPKDPGEEKTFQVALPAPPAPEKVGTFGLPEALGIYPSELFVKQVSTNSPAEKGGLQPGDRIVKVADKPIYSFEYIVDVVQEYGANNQPIPFTLEREGQTVILNLKPIQTTLEDPLTRQEIKKYMVGFLPNNGYAEAEATVVQIREPVRLLKHAASETALLAERMVISIGKLVTGKISAKNLGGPVLIASVAGKSLDAGLIPFLQMMALISINLFLLNLFPVPVLDGGHLFFFTIEALKGKPVSIRTMEIANQVGMVLILMLVGLTLFNDISRIVQH